MSRYYRRTPPGRKVNLGAGLISAGLALGVASISFYLVRTFLAREPLPELPSREEENNTVGSGATGAEEGGA